MRVSVNLHIIQLQKNYCLYAIKSSQLFLFCNDELLNNLFNGRHQFFPKTRKKHIKEESLHKFIIIVLVFVGKTGTTP